MKALEGLHVKPQRRPKNKAEAEFFDYAESNNWVITKKGAPDFACFLPNSDFCFVEVKATRTRRLKAWQWKVMEKLSSYGIKCYRWSPETGFTKIIAPRNDLPSVTPKLEITPTSGRIRRIYLASSLYNKETVVEFADILRKQGHDVDCFCDKFNVHHIFSWRDLAKEKTELDALEFIQNPRTQEEFVKNKKHLDWADTVIVILPCGKSSCLEAGYAKGLGKEVFIVGHFPKGEIDISYGFADGLYRIEPKQMDALWQRLKN